MIKSAIFWGTILGASVIALFAIAVVGATGSSTTSDSLSGLNAALNGKIVYFALLFGLLCIVTSCLTALQSLRETYWWDLKANKNVSLLLAFLPPIALFVFGVQNLTTVVGMTGAITGGALGMIMVYMARRASIKPEKKGSPIRMAVPAPLAILLSLIFIAGFVYQIYSIF